MGNEKLTVNNLSRMRLGGRDKTFRCDNAAQFESARKNFYYIRKHCPRQDGATYKARFSYPAMTITVTLERDESDERVSANI